MAFVGCAALTQSIVCMKIGPSCTETHPEFAVSLDEYVYNLGNVFRLRFIFDIDGLRSAECGPFRIT